MGWTLPALLAGAKTCSRQTWGSRGAGTMRAGSEVTVYSGAAHPSARRGPRTVAAIIRLTGDPVLEPLSAMPDADYDAEGWRWLHDHPEALRSHRITADDFSWEAFERWRARPGQCWVVRFEVLKVAVTSADFIGRLAAA